MIEIRNRTGALDLALIEPETISALDETRQHALLALMKANEIKEAAVTRRNAATKRVNDAIADEQIKRQIADDASSPIPFAPIVAKLEADFGRELHPHELAEAREKHGARVRALREQEARQAVINAYNSSH